MSRETPRDWASDPDTLLTIKDIAEILEVEKSNVREILRRGTIPSSTAKLDYYHEPVRVVRSEDLQAYLHKRFFTRTVKLPKRNKRGLAKFLKKVEQDGNK